MASKKKTALSAVVLLAGTVGTMHAAADEPRENPVVVQPANRAELGRRGQGDKVNRLRTITTRNAFNTTAAAGQKQALGAADRVEPVASENKAAIASGAADGRATKVQAFTSGRKTALTAKDAGKVNRLNEKTIQSRLVSEKAPQKSASLPADAAAAARDNPEQAAQKQ